MFPGWPHVDLTYCCPVGARAGLQKNCPSSMAQCTRRQAASACPRKQVRLSPLSQQSVTPVCVCVCVWAGARTRLCVRESLFVLVCVSVCVSATLQLSKKGGQSILPPYSTLLLIRSQPPPATKPQVTTIEWEIGCLTGIPSPFTSAGMGGTPRGRSSTCEQRDNGPTLTCENHGSPPSVDKHCGMCPPETPNQARTPGGPNGAVSEPLWQASDPGIHLRTPPHLQVKIDTRIAQPFPNPTPRYPSTSPGLQHVLTAPQDSAGGPRQCCSTTKTQPIGTPPSA